MTNENKNGADGSSNNNGGGDEGELDLDLDQEGADGEGKDGKDKDGEGKDQKPTNKFANETPEQRSARLDRMKDQHDKKHSLGKYKPADNTDKPSKQPGELDYGQKAYLVSNGIKGGAEMEFTKNMLKETGKDIDALLESPYFQSELKTFREKQASKDALPNNSRRSGNPATDSVEYWIAKGELPPADQAELRRKVVNAKIKAQSSGSPFTKNPIVGQ